MKSLLQLRKCLLSYIFPLCFLLSWPSCLPRTAGIVPTRYKAFRVPMETVQFCVNQEGKETNSQEEENVIDNRTVVCIWAQPWIVYVLPLWKMGPNKQNYRVPPKVLMYSQPIVSLCFGQEGFLSLGSRWRSGLQWLWDKNHLFAENDYVPVARVPAAPPQGGLYFQPPFSH